MQLEMLKLYCSGMSSWFRENLYLLRYLFIKSDKLVSYSPSVETLLIPAEI